MTRRLTTLISFLLFTFLSFGQSVNQKDSLIIMSKVHEVFKLFENPDFSEFEKISTENIYCLICFDKPAFTDAPYSLKRKVFFENHLKNISQADYFDRTKKSREFVLMKANNRLTDIIVLFTIYKEGELAPGHEGGQLGIYFKKIKNIYKFAGIETIS